MKTELEYYDIYPKVVKSGENTCVTVKPLGRHVAFEAGYSYKIKIMPLDESKEPVYDYDTIHVAPNENGCLSFFYTFTGEQEYYIRIYHAHKEDRMDLNVQERRFNLHVYALMPDVFERFAYRGDLHAHSFHSDGKEAPEIVASNYRKHGFDFFAQTDHRKLFPSLECIEFFKDKPVDFVMYTGEEIHAPDCFVHVVNIGSKYSVNEIFQKNPEKYRSEVEALIPTLDVPEGVSPFVYAACVWIFERVKEAGGFSIFPHPHWLADVFHVPIKLVNLLFERKPFDAFELLGGQEVHSNNLQVEYYYSELAKGHNVPIVGSSDSHGTVNRNWFTWTSTIVFSKDLKQENVFDAIRDGYSVAVEQYPGETYRVHGSYRMVKFARFLLEEYFPIHDALCFEEGRLMKDLVCNEEGALEALALFKGRVPKLLRKYWA